MRQYTILPHVGLQHTAIWRTSLQHCHKQTSLNSAWEWSRGALVCRPLCRRSVQLNTQQWMRAHAYCNQSTDLCVNIHLPAGDYL